MKKCKNCGEFMEDTQVFCNNCNWGNNSNNKKAKRKIIIVSLIILLGIIIFTTLFIINKKEEHNKFLMISDAREILRSADIQKQMEEIASDSKTKCLYIYGYDSAYKNSGNYVGSIDISKEEPYIWLSDGNYYITGNYENLEILKSNLKASTNCNLLIQD